jgi:SAM-dependent methyltransferase
MATGRSKKGFDLGPWGPLLGIIAVVVIWNLLSEYGKKHVYGREGFEDTKKEFEVVRGSSIFDDFYVSVYDDLLLNTIKNEFEIGTIVNSTQPSEKSIILDIGSGTGHHVGALQEQGYNVAGLDISPAMVKAATKNYPTATFLQGDAEKANFSNPSSYTHILCLYFTIYYIKDKRQFFNNCYTWLKPGGYLVLHLVDRSAFDPILPAGSPLALIDPQKYAAERITQTAVEFDTQGYTADFSLDEEGDTAEFTEIFKDKTTGSVRKNVHDLYMPTQKQIIQDAREAGFIIVSHSEMSECQYRAQYLYVLQKPG